MRGGRLVEPTTQQCCGRIANVGSKQSIQLADITVQYWFNGPEGIALDPVSSPNLLFQLVCSDATTGAAMLASSVFPCRAVKAGKDRSFVSWTQGKDYPHV